MDVEEQPDDDHGALLMSAPHTPPPSSPVIKLKAPRRPDAASALGEEQKDKEEREEEGEGEDEEAQRRRWHQQDLEDKQLFLRRLYAFLEGKGQPITKMPSLGYQELDLHHLYRLVTQRGGMDQVTQRQEWKTAYQDLGLPTMSTSASYNTRTNYKKYLYLYELEHCDFPDQPRPPGKEPRHCLGDHIRIVSQTYEGQVFYAQVLKCRYRDGQNVYYVHYNGWSTSHDEWMPEQVLSPLLPEERLLGPDKLANPPPSRSSKSNHIISDVYFAGEKHFHPRTPRKGGSSHSSPSYSPLPGESTAPSRKSSPLPAPSDDLNAEIGGQRGKKPRYVGSEEEEEEWASRRKRMPRTKPSKPDWSILKRELSALQACVTQNLDCRLLLRESNLHLSMIDSSLPTCTPTPLGEADLQHLEDAPYEPCYDSANAWLTAVDAETVERLSELREALRREEGRLRDLLTQRDVLERALAEKIADATPPFNLRHHPHPSISPSSDSSASINGSRRR